MADATSLERDENGSVSVTVAPTQERPLVPAVTRAVAILDLLASDPQPIGISEIARRLRIPKSSVANLCTTLADAGLVRTVGGGFALGQRLAQLGAAYLAGVDQVQLFHTAVKELDAAHDETIQLALLGDGLDVIYLAKRDGVFPVRLASTPGRVLPASCTATGKAMLAQLPAGELARRLANTATLPKLTPSSITSVARLETELDAIRRDGVSYDREEVIEGVVCVAAAIPATGPSGQSMAVSATLLKPRATPTHLDQLAADLTLLAAAIARGLGAGAHHATR